MPRFPKLPAPILHFAVTTRLTKGFLASFVGSAHLPLRVLATTHNKPYLTKLPIQAKLYLLAAAILSKYKFHGHSYNSVAFLSTTQVS